MATGAIGLSMAAREGEVSEVMIERVCRERLCEEVPAIGDVTDRAIRIEGTLVRIEMARGARSCRQFGKVDDVGLVFERRVAPVASNVDVFAREWEGCQAVVE